MDVVAVKRRAEGRTLELLHRVANIPEAVLDGQHHPCPGCGGSDRFRLVDAEAGAVYCNGCFRKKNGDFLSAVGHYRGVNFKEALRLCAEYLGVANGQGEKPRNGSARRETAAAPLPSGREKKLRVPQHEGHLKKYYYPPVQYRFRDADGRLVYAEFRYEVRPEYAGEWVPKVFRAKRPDGKGRWADGKGDAADIPYRLPELLAADATEWVFITEGLKHAERLAELGFVATSNFGGSGKGDWKTWGPAFFSGRRVCILPDNDEPGERHTQKVAEALSPHAAEVRVLELPGLPQKGDVLDWLETGGTPEQLRELVAACPSWTDGQKENDSWEPFPVDALPSPIKEYVEAAARALDCDPAMIALPSLAVLGSAIGNTRRVEIKPSWVRPPVLWAAVVARSGTMKSPALEMAVKPLRDAETAAFHRYKQAEEEYRQELAHHERAMAAWKKSGGGDPPERPEEPSPERFLLADTTAEAAADRLASNPRGLLLCVDELSGWLASFDAYKSTQGRDAAAYLGMYDAGSVTIDRKGGRQVTRIDSAALAICGGVQPGILRLCLAGRGGDDGEYISNGMAARFLFASPPPRPKRWTDATLSAEDRAVYAYVVDGLLGLPMDLDANGDPAPRPIPLGEEARRRFIDYYNNHAAKTQIADDALAASFSKLEEIPARLALIFHQVRVVTGTAEHEGEIGGQSMRDGIRLARWFANEADRIISQVVPRDQAAEKLADQQRTDRKILDLINNHGGEITPRILRDASAKHRGAGEAQAALDAMVSRGTLARSERKPEGRGRPSIAYRLATAEEDHGGQEEATVPPTVVPAGDSLDGLEWQA